MNTVIQLVSSRTKGALQLQILCFSHLCIYPQQNKSHLWLHSQERKGSKDILCQSPVVQKVQSYNQQIFSIVWACLLLPVQSKLTSDPRPLPGRGLKKVKESPISQAAKSFVKSLARHFLGLINCQLWTLGKLLGYAFFFFPLPVLLPQCDCTPRYPPQGLRRNAHCSRAHQGWGRKKKVKSVKQVIDNHYILELHIPLWVNFKNTFSEKSKLQKNMYHINISIKF